MQYVIIGNGGAGVRAARTIRERDGEGTITIVDPEPYRCYYRMRLPDYISGKRALDSIYVVDEDFYAKHDIHLITEERITRVIPEKHIVVLESGGILDYDRLLIASGSRPRTRPCRNPAWASSSSSGDLRCSADSVTSSPPPEKIPPPPDRTRGNQDKLPPGPGQESRWDREGPPALPGAPGPHSSQGRRASTSTSSPGRTSTSRCQRGGLGKGRTATR